MPKPHWLLIPLRWLAHLSTWPLAVLVAFEEWGWEPLQRVLARIGAWPGLRWIEGAIRRLPTYAALALFARCLRYFEAPRTLAALLPREGK